MSTPIRASNASKPKPPIQIPAIASPLNFSPRVRPIIPKTTAAIKNGMPKKPVAAVNRMPSNAHESAKMLYSRPLKTSYF